MHLRFVGPALLTLALALSACASPARVRFAVPSAPAGEPIAVDFKSVEVQDVSLPDYARDDRIFVAGPGGALERSDVLWADDPERALTLDLVRVLGTVTDAQVAGRPWPFQERPEARVDVRVAEFVASIGAVEPSADRADPGAFLLRGQFFVGSFDGSGRSRVREFRIDVPLAPNASLAAIAAARAEATVVLARMIAAEGLR